MNAATPTLPEPKVWPAFVTGLLLAMAMLLLATCSGGTSGKSGTTNANSAASTNSTGSSGSSSSSSSGTTPAPVSFIFGAQTHFAQGLSADAASRVAAGGINDVRDELYWDVVEPTPGTYQFPASFDAYMAALKNNGIAPLVELDFENHNYDQGLTPYTDAGIAAYTRYATSVLQHYGTQIGAVEVWNEYNGSFANGPATDDRAGTYLRMLKATYAAVKAARPDVIVAGASTAGVPLPYLEKLFAGGALNSLDAVSVHPYRYDSPPEGIELQIAALRNLMSRYGGGAKEIWATEYGWGVRGAVASGDINIDEATQAKFLVRAAALMVSAGVKRAYWYQFRDDPSGATMGLVQADNAMTARQAFSAIKTLNAKLRSATFVAREQTSSGVYSIRFTDTLGRELRVLWALSPFNVNVPSGTSVTDMLGNNVNGANLRVTDSPVYVTGALPNLPGSGTVSALSAITDSASGFSLTQGNYGWSYGYFNGASTAFQPLTETRITDWKEEWTSSALPAISITNADQHPSYANGQPVSVVRRWTSAGAATVHVTARFKVGTQGDGVRVRVLADGQLLYTATLNVTTSIATTFDFQRFVPAGGTLDFAVDPGTAGNIDFDATETSIAIENAP